MTASKRLSRGLSRRIGQRRSSRFLLSIASVTGHGCPGRCEGAGITRRCRLDAWRRHHVCSLKCSRTQVCCSWTHTGTGRSEPGPNEQAQNVLHVAEVLWNNPIQKRQNDLKAAGRVQGAATREEPPKELQDWDARAAQEVAAARARGAQLPALVDRKEHRAEFLRRKAERAEAEASSKPHDSGLNETAAAAKAEVPAQHLPAFSGVAPVLSSDFYGGSHHTLSMVLPW